MASLVGWEDWPVGQGMAGRIGYRLEGWPTAAASGISGLSNADAEITDVFLGHCLAAKRIRIAEYRLWNVFQGQGPGLRVSHEL